VPVAKINFSTRHKHGEVKASRRDTDESSRGGIKRTALEALQKAKAIDMARVEISSRKVLVQGTEAMSASGLDSAHEEDRLQTMPKSESESQLQLKAKSSLGIALEGFATVFSNEKPKISGPEETRFGGSSGRDERPRKKKRARLQRKWLSLLDERPPTNDRTKMKSWLKLVAAFSDPEEPPSSFTSITSSEDSEDSELSRLVEQGLAATELDTNQVSSVLQYFKANMKESKGTGASLRASSSED
jgi:hypothetical protein